MADVSAQSDEIFVHNCDACMYNSLRSEGIAFCVECQEYLCTDCLRVHRRNKVLRGHQILQGSDLNEATTASSPPLPFQFCHAHKASRVEFFCMQHDSVFCKSCKTLDHRRCDVKEIERVCSKQHDRNAVSSFLDRITVLLARLKSVQDEREAGADNLRMQGEEVIREVKKFRADITDMLDRLEAAMTKDIEAVMQKETERLKEHVSSLETTIQQLETDINNLETARTHGDDWNLFVAMKKVGEEKMEGILHDISGEKCSTVVKFEPDPRLNNLLSTLQSLGTFKVTTTESTPASLTPRARAAPSRSAFMPEEMKNKKITKVSQLNVRETHDKETCWIRGSVFLPNGQLLLTDHNNDTLKLVDINTGTLTSLRLPGCPWDVALVDDEEAVVAIHNEHCLQFVGLDPGMTLGRVVDVGRMCLGVAVCGDKLFVSCHNDPGEGEVLELDLQGTVLRRLRGTEDGTFGFNSPYYIAVNSRVDRLYVSDFSQESVTCMRMDGTVVYKFTGREIKCPFQLLVDTANNVYVSDGDLQRVLVLTKEGRKHRVLLSEGLKEPLTLAYRGQDHTLVVGAEKSDIVQVYRFTD